MTSDLGDLGYTPGGATSGLQQLQDFARNARGPSMRQTFGIRLTDIECGRVVCRSRPSRKALNSLGGIHGGYVATLLDSACGNAVHSVLAPQQIYTTVELKVSFLRPIPVDADEVMAVGRVVQIGKTIAFAEAVLYGADSTPLATATSTILLKSVE